MHLVLGILNPGVDGIRAQDRETLGLSAMRRQLGRARDVAGMVLLSYFFRVPPHSAPGRNFIMANTDLRSPTFLVLLLIAPFFLASCTEQDENTGAASVTVFEGARLILGDGSEPIEDGALVVQGDRVTLVGRVGEIEMPPGAVLVDLAGKTVMPAIINSHMHLGATREELVSQLEHNAYYGVGSVLSLGLDSSEVNLQVRNELIPGAARYQTAWRGITRPEEGRSEVPYWVDTEEEVRTAVQDLAAKGPDFVKIWVDDRNGQYPKMTPELYGAVIDGAHEQGLRVGAHIFALDDAKGLLRAGVDMFAHGVRDRDIDDEFISLVVERPQTVLVPNMGNRGVATDLSWLSQTIPAAQLSEMQAAATDRPEAQASYAIQARNLKRLVDVGMKIAHGSDGRNPWAPHLEMEDMVAAGMTPAQVIVAATSGSAELLGLTDVGTLQSGKVADFVVLDANPLDDITNTRRIDAVYLRGEAVDRAAVSARLLGGAATTP